MNEKDEQFPAMTGYGPGDYTRTRKPKAGARRMTEDEVAEADEHNRRPHDEDARVG